jgi:hypothetical protein
MVPLEIIENNSPQDLDKDPGIGLNALDSNFQQAQAPWLKHLIFKRLGLARKQ